MDSGTFLIKQFMKFINLNLNYVTIYSLSVFIFIVAGLHLMQTHYDPVHQLMSELALGQYGFLMLFAFLAFSLALFSTQQSLSSYKNSLQLTFVRYP